MLIHTDGDVHVQAAGEKAIADLEASLKDFYNTLETSTPATADRVKQEVPILQQAALNLVGNIEEAMVQGFPFEVPDKYADLPQLKVISSSYYQPQGKLHVSDGPVAG